MYSKSKQTFYHVRDSLIKHRWLLTAELIWMIVCSFWTVSEQEKMYQFYNLSASTIDYVIAQQGAIYSGLTIISACTFFRNQMQTGQSEHSIYLTVSIEKKNVSATTEGESGICCGDFFYNYPNGYIYWLDL